MCSSEWRARSGSWHGRGRHGYANHLLQEGAFPKVKEIDAYGHGELQYEELASLLS